MNATKEQLIYELKTAQTELINLREQVRRLEAEKYEDGLKSAATIDTLRGLLDRCRTAWRAVPIGYLLAFLAVEIALIAMVFKAWGAGE